MKNSIALFIAVALVALGCEQDLLIQKEYIRDTIYLEKEKFIDRVFVETDTIEIPVTIEVDVPTRVQDTIIVNVSDTIYIDRVDTIKVEKIVYVPRVDSVFIETIVYLRDTIMVRDFVYGDTLYISSGRDYYSVPEEIQPFVSQFFIDAQAYGHNPNGGEMLIEVVEMDDVIQAYGFEVYGQVFIRVNANLTNDERYLPVTRELARLQLGKEYSQDPESVLYPFFNASIIRWSNRNAHKEKLKDFF